MKTKKTVLIFSIMAIILIVELMTVLILEQATKPNSDDLSEKVTATYTSSNEKLDLAKIKSRNGLEYKYLVLDIEENADAIVERLNDEKMLTDNTQWVEESWISAHWDAQVSLGFLDYQIGGFDIYKNTIIFSKGFNYKGKDKELFHKVLEVILQTEDKDTIKTAIDGMRLYSNYTEVLENEQEIDSNL